MARRRRGPLWKASPSAFALLLPTLFLQIVQKHIGYPTTAEARVRPDQYQLALGPSDANNCWQARSHYNRSALREKFVANHNAEEVAESKGNGRGGWRGRRARGSNRQPSLFLLSHVGTVATSLRGGEASLSAEAEGGEVEEVVVEEEEEEEERVQYDEKAVEWMMQQLCMYQTRTALISRPLAAKGYKLREIVPSPRGLLCALSTEERRMDCRMYVEAEVGKKVVAPCKCKGTQKWISFSALNSERRKEAAKWRNCPVCQGPIDYKLYEKHGGEVGKAISAVLNNVGATRAAIALLASVALLLVSPVLHVVMVRVLTSGILWMNYERLLFLFHLQLPMKIVLVRLAMKYCYSRLLVLETLVRQWLTEVESQILETRLPVTVEVDENGEEVAIANPRP